MPTARLQPVPIAARFIAETLLYEMDMDNGNSCDITSEGDCVPNTGWRSGKCPYPPEIMAKLEASVQAAINKGWMPTLHELEVIASGEERSMKRVLSKVPAGQGPYIHEVIDFCFNYGWEPDSPIQGEKLGDPPAAS